MSDEEDPNADLFRAEALLPAIEWASDQIMESREYEEIEGDLLSAGWDAGTASYIVEEARVRMREKRGKITRESARVDHARRTDAVFVDEYGRRFRP